MARLPSLRALFTRARDTAPAPVAEISADRHAAGVELLEAQRGVDTAQAAFDAGLLDPAADRRALDDARRDAGLRLDAAKALCAAFSEKAVEAQAAERRAELNRLVAEADATQAAYTELVTNDMPAIGAAVRGIMRAWAVAGIAREAANRALEAADAGEPRPSVEAFRISAGRPERTLRSERVELWTDAGGEPAGVQDEVVRQSDGSGYLRLPNAQHARIFRHRRPFERKEVLAAEHGRVPELLASSMVIPGVMASDQPAWVPLSAPTPSRVLAQLDRLERHVEPEGDTRQPRTVLKAVGPAVEVAKPAQVPNLRAS